MPSHLIDPATLLESLVHFRTAQPDADERPLAHHLAQLLSAHRPDQLVTVEVPRDGAHGAYVFARWGRPKLLLNAHIDTVPPNDGWLGDPFVARRTHSNEDQSERLIALGAADTKGAIAAILCALDLERPADLAILFSGDEEHGGTSMRAFLASEHARGIIRAIAFEPTSCRVGTRHRGILSPRARLAGKGGHSSLADTLPAPLAELSRIAVSWADYGISHRETGPEGFRGLCMNIAKLDGGVAFNVVPEEATLIASVRPAPGADTPRIKSELIELARAIAPSIAIDFPIDKGPFATRDIHTFALFPPVTAAPAVDLAYWTEASLLAEAGIDAIVYGPGDISHAHAAEEWVPIAELNRARDDVAALVAALRDG